jgi:hypothetical protein
MRRYWGPCTAGSARNAITRHSNPPGGNVNSNRSKYEVEKSGQQGPQEKSEPEDLLFKGDRPYDQNSSAMQGGMRG